jgi:hypothetical protein
MLVHGWVGWFRRESHRKGEGTSGICLEVLRVVVLSMLQALAAVEAQKLKLKALPLARLRAVGPALLYDCLFPYLAHHYQCNPGLAVTES